MSENPVLTIICRNCKHKFIIKVKGADYNDWIDGKKISEALPYLSKEEQTLIEFHACGKCFR